MSNRWFTVFTLILGLVFVSACSKMSWKNERTYELRPSAKNEFSVVKSDESNRMVQQKSSNTNFHSNHQLNPRSLKCAKFDRSRYTSFESKGLLLQTENLPDHLKRVEPSPNELTLVQLAQNEFNSEQQNTIELDLNEVALDDSKAIEPTQNCVHLNNANLSELVTLPGIGEKRARVIMSYRSKHPFRRKSDITKIKGIGKKTYAKLSPLLCDL